MPAGFYTVKTAVLRVVSCDVRNTATSAAVGKAQELLAGVRGRVLDDTQAASAAADVAALLAQAVELETSEDERARVRALAGLTRDRRGRALVTLLTDRAYRSSDPGRIVDASRYLLRTLGIPKHFGWTERAKLRALLHAGPFFPGAAAGGMLDELRDQTRAVVWSAEPQELAARLSERRTDGVRVNLNQLGEAVLGQHDAERRLAQYVELLARPEVEAISVKLSSISARVDVHAYDATLAELRPRLQAVYEAAAAHRFVGTDGSSMSKVVSVDMEAYRDLALTFELITTVLDAPSLRNVRACVVLQAYLPDAHRYQRALIEWSARRVAAGGVPIRLRLVKGANLAAERVESSMRGWPLPTYSSKREVDANYKRMLQWATDPQHASVANVGVASHNLFDIALGLVLRESRGLGARLGIELLEGMAQPLQRVLVALGVDVLVYCPAAAPSSMQSAIAYLMRRLDESTAPENFLPQSFVMRAGDAVWQKERERFEVAWRERDAVSESSPRTSDGREPSKQSSLDEPFGNEPDTDFALPGPRAVFQAALDALHERACFDVQSHIAGAAVSHAASVDGFDPSRPGHVPYRFATANEADIERALACAERARVSATAVPVAARCATLLAAAQGLRARRAELVAAMVLDAGKRVDQADTEVSEAIDFAEHYARSYFELSQRTDLTLRPKGTVLVTPPWNFPLAIPAGGVFAALVAGNAVILKPAIETVLVARLLAETCWSAGVDPKLLQFVLCEDTLGSRLITDPRVHTVNLTGATSTARLFQSLRPALDLVAETGGKNAIVISALADRDEAIKHVLQSAFGHAGQKCSAASLCVCEAEVYDDPAFQRVLADAVESLPVGSAWDARSVVTPLIRPPSGPLARGLNTLEPGESWLVPPRVDADNPRLVGPSAKLGVSENSFTHTTELFGPVLGVMRARDLDHAIAIVNGTPYGLTSGLCSLDEREQVRWSDRIHAGNLYINRPITGAVVRRQPFGGHKGSSFGSGAKAGGPNYVLNFCTAQPPAAPVRMLDAPMLDAAELLARLRRHIARGDHKHLAAAACEYAQGFREGFAELRDPSSVLGELNVLRYLPHEAVVIRAGADAVIGEALLACLAALTVGARPLLSMSPNLMEGAPWLTSLPLVQCVGEDASARAAQLRPHVTRVRAVGPVEATLRDAAIAAGVHVADAPIHSSGRVELLHYLREQSLSVAYHRHGSLESKRLLPWAAAQARHIG